MDNGASSYRRFLDGDEGGLAEIVDAYKDGLILYLNGYVNNIYIAEELMEETFFRLLVKRPGYSPKSSFKTWLFAIGRNIAVDYIRKGSKLPSVPIEDIEDYLSDETDLERSYIKNEQKIALHKAMMKLSSDYREVLYLSFFEDFTNEEVAKTIGKSSRQVRNLLYRAKLALKSELEKEGFIYEEY